MNSELLIMRDSFDLSSISNRRQGFHTISQLFRKRRLGSAGRWAPQVVFFLSSYIKLNITTQHYFFRELNSTIFHRFLAVNYNSALSFFPARQVSEKIFDESSKSTKNAPIDWLQKDTKKYFLKSKVYIVVSLLISVVSKTGFEIFLAHLVCLKSEK
jgi:hypothetical protein